MTAPSENTTSWPEWTCITQPAPDTDPDGYHGECFRCRGEQDGARSLVEDWAQNHWQCTEGGV